MSACLILAIRTARREAKIDPLLSNREWDQEIENAVALARRVLLHATTHHPEMFRQIVVKFTDGVCEEDTMK